MLFKVQPMSDITRYDLEYDYCHASMVVESDGNYVSYEDHVAAIAEKDKKIERLRYWLHYKCVVGNCEGDGEDCPKQSQPVIEPLKGSRWMKDGKEYVVGSVRGDVVITGTFYKTLNTWPLEHWYKNFTPKESDV